jgi:hypothetical protein
MGRVLFKEKVSYHLPSEKDCNIQVYMLKYNIFIYYLRVINK